jgi:hypothetical protein
LPTLPISALTGAYLASGTAWLLVLAYAILTRSPEDSSGGCDLLDCVGSAGDEIFYFLVLGPPFFALSLLGAGLAIRAFRVGEPAAAVLPAFALSAAGPTAYAFMAAIYG